MQGRVQPATESKTALRTGQVLSGLAIVFMLVDAVMKAFKAEPSVVTTVALGYPESQVAIIGLIELVFLIRPFIEAKEVVGGYAVYDVASKEEAIEWMNRFMQIHLDLWPGYEGEAEIRQIMEPPSGPPQE